MRIEIDQSNKIEITNRDSILAFSNSISYSILIPAKEKRKLQALFRKTNTPQMFRYKVFAIAIVILIKDYIRKIDDIIIDKEYQGWEPLIKDIIIQHIRQIKGHFSHQNITFLSIGKKSNAHKIAYAINKKKLTANKTITAIDIIKFLIK